MTTRLPILTPQFIVVAACLAAGPAHLAAQTPGAAIKPTENAPAGVTKAPPGSTPQSPPTQADTPVPPRPVPLLKVGDTAAPASFEKLLLGEWKDLKPGFGDGTVYVLEFWATWCPVCRRTFPHLAELSTSLRTTMGDKAPVMFAVSGVDGRGENQDKAARAIVKMREQGLLPADPQAKQPIIFAFDDAAVTRQAFLRPARIAALPAAIVIDGAGKIAWIGNPATQREDFVATVKAVAGGTFDMAGARERFEKQLAERALIDEQAVALQAELRTATTDNQLDHAIVVMDALIALDKDRFGRLAASKLEALLKSKPDGVAALSYAREIMTGPLRDDTATLEAVSWTLLDVDDPATLPADRIAIAFDAAALAVKATLEEDARALDALARAYFARGDLVMAEKTQSRAAMLSAGEPTFEAIRERLLQYREAVDSKKKPR